MSRSIHPFSLLGARVPRPFCHHQAFALGKWSVVGTPLAMSSRLSDTNVLLYWRPYWRPSSLGFRSVAPRGNGTIQKTRPPTQHGTWRFWRDTSYGSIRNDPQPTNQPGPQRIPPVASNLRVKQGFPANLSRGTWLTP